MEIFENHYLNLCSQLQKTLEAMRGKVMQIVNQQKVETSWKMGQMIDAYLVQNGRAGYGEKLFVKLAKDIGLSNRVLYQMHGFYKQYPTLPGESHLSWSHYKILSGIHDSVSRDYFQDLAISSSLGVRELEREVVKVLPTKEKRQKPQTKTKDETPLRVKRGHLFTYKIKQFPHRQKKMIDCGFNIFREVETQLDDGVVVTSKKNGKEYSFVKYAKESSKIHTYKAFLERVVDGDTIRVVLDLGFGTHHREILRLSGINAPERKTTAGKKSSVGLVKMLKDAPFLIIKTNKLDIYGRYIADVFFSKNGEKDPQKVADEGVYASQRMLDLGLAKKY